jgi:hypothetical protein
MGSPLNNMSLIQHQDLVTSEKINFSKAMVMAALLEYRYK